MDVYFNLRVIFTVILAKNQMNPRAARQGKP